MATDSRSSGNVSRFDERYTQLQKIGVDDLGEFYRAQNSDQVQVLAFKFYNWVGDLPAEQHQRLEGALAALRQLTHPFLLRITTYHIGPPRAGDSVNYIEFADTAIATLDLWPRWPLHNRLSEAAIIVGTLAQKLPSLHQQAIAQQIDWLRPVLNAAKIWLPNFKDANRPANVTLLPSPLQLALPDLGVAAWLSKPANEPQLQVLTKEQEEIRALGLLLLQLLRNPKNFAESPQTPTQIDQVQIDQAQTEVVTLYPAEQPALTEFFRRCLNPHLHADGYRTTLEVADALRPLSLSGTLPLMDLQSIKQTTPTNSQDELIVELINPGPQDKPRYQRLQKNAIVTLGGGDTDDLRLQGVTPRRLLVLYQNGQYTERYVVTDSRNHAATHEQAALLDGLPLSPYFAAVFHENSRLELAGYRIQLRQTRLTANPLTSLSSRPLQIAQTRYVGNPGAVIQLQATIRNVTNEVDSFWIAVDGAPESMHFELPAPQRLFEEGSVNVVVTIHLPLLAASTAGEVPLILRLISENYRVQIAALRIFITILPHYDFVGVLLPETLRLGDDGVVVIENQGNLTRIFAIQWRDRAQELDFVPPEAVLTVPAQSTARVTYRAYLRKQQWRLLGRPLFHNVHVLVTPRGGGVPQTLAGQVISRALIPVWAPAVALLLLLLFLFVATFLFQPEIVRPVTVYARTPAKTDNRTLVTPDWVAVPTPFAGTPFSLLWQSAGSCFYSVYENDVITRGPQFMLNLSDQVMTYEVQDRSEGTIIEVRLRSCLLIGERKWRVVVQPPPVTTPTPTATVVPAIIVSQGEVIYPEQPIMSARPVQQKGDDGVTRLLVGQIGDLCFAWEAVGVGDSLMIIPNLQVAVTGAKGEHCLPIAETFRAPNGSADYALVGKQGETEVISKPFARIEIRQPICRVNIDAGPGSYLALREGPGRNFPERGRLQKDNRVLVLARPFMPLEQDDGLEWLLITLENDPRPAWVAYRERRPLPEGATDDNQYLACPPDIGLLPNAATIPQTPTPTPTGTPEPTVTPTAVPASEVSLEPPVVNPGGCATLKWKIENVDKIYLNDEGVIGESERQVCPTAPGQYLYEWRILKKDGSLIKIAKTLTVNPGPPGTPAVPTPPE